MSQDEQVGSLGEEAAKLAAALQESLSDWAGHNIADGSAACRVCPLCQLIALVRQLDPDTVDRIGDLVEGLVRTLRGLVERLADTEAGRRGAGVQKINLSDGPSGEPGSGEPGSGEPGSDREGEIPWE